MHTLRLRWVLLKTLLDTMTVDLYAIFHLMHKETSLIRVKRCINIWVLQQVIKSHFDSISI